MNAWAYSIGLGKYYQSKSWFYLELELEELEDDEELLLLKRIF